MKVHNASVKAGSSHCGALLEKIDYLLARAKLQPQDAAAVEALRDKGASLYHAGRLAECMTPLRQAAELLGMEVPSCH